MTLGRKKGNLKSFITVGGRSSEETRRLKTALRNSNGKILDMPSGAKEYQSDEIHTNDETSTLAGEIFKRKGERLQGWKLRFRIGSYWCWYLQNDQFVLQSEYDPKKDGPVKIFKCGEKIPYIPVNQIDRVVADAKWVKNNSLYWKIKRKVGLFK